MAAPTPMSREVFECLAARAGLDTSGPHLDQLFLYVLNVQSGLQSLDQIAVAGVEPDMAFVPPQE
jgi:hypothetical protein